MHASSYQHMAVLVDRHLSRARPLRILDVGSCDINGSYRPLFDAPAWQYIGLDLAPGPNVDRVLPTAHRWDLPSGWADVIVSGQAFEHMAYFWLCWLEMTRVLKPNGWIFLIAPSRGPEHRYPVDCWRFYPDGYRALAHYGDLELVQADTDWTPRPDTDPDSAPWGDTVGVFRKPPRPLWQRWRQRCLQAALARLAPPEPGQSPATSRPTTVERAER